MAKKKKSKKSGAVSISEVTSSYVPVEIPADSEEWVTVNFKLINWTYMNFSVTISTKTPLFSLKRRLKDKHGDVKEMRMYKGQVTEANELKDDEATLKELGFSGAPKDAAEPATETVFYDYNPYVGGSPLLLITPRKYE